MEIYAEATTSLCTHGAHANAHDWRIYQTHSPSRASLYAQGTNMRTHIPDVSEYGWRVWHALHCSSPQSLAASSAICIRSCQHLFIYMWIDEVPVHNVCRLRYVVILVAVHILKRYRIYIHISIRHCKIGGQRLPRKMQAEEVSR